MTREATERYSKQRPKAINEEDYVAPDGPMDTIIECCIAVMTLYSNLIGQHYCRKTLLTALFRHMSPSLANYVKSDGCSFGRRQVVELRT